MVLVALVCPRESHKLCYHARCEFLFPACFTSRNVNYTLSESQITWLQPGLPGSLGKYQVVTPQLPVEFPGQLRVRGAKRAHLCIVRSKQEQARHIIDGSPNLHLSRLTMPMPIPSLSTSLNQTGQNDTRLLPGLRDGDIGMDIFRYTRAVFCHPHHTHHPHCTWPSCIARRAVFH